MVPGRRRRRRGCQRRRDGFARPELRGASHEAGAGVLGLWRPLDGGSSGPYVRRLMVGVIVLLMRALKILPPSDSLWIVIFFLLCPHIFQCNRSSNPPLGELSVLRCVMAQTLCSGIAPSGVGVYDFQGCNVPRKENEHLEINDSIFGSTCE